MLIALEIKQTNIAEYILYMWQIEDIIRGFKFDVQAIDQNIISQYKQDDIIKAKIKNWYNNIIIQMKTQNIQNNGHLESTNHEIQKLNNLHIQLLNNNSEKEYQQIYSQTQPILNEQKLKQKAPDQTTDTEIALNTLYGILILRLQQKNITTQTQQATTQISKLIATLTKKYHEQNNNNK